MSSYAYTVPSSAAGTATAGTFLSESDKAQILGKDIFFDNDMAVSPSKDWVPIDGIEAVRQAVYHRLITKPGEFSFRPEYGVGARSFVKKRNRPIELRQLEARIRENLVQDPRIQAVGNIVIGTIDDGIKINIAIQVNGKELTNLPFRFSEIA